MTPGYQYGASPARGRPVVDGVPAPRPTPQPAPPGPLPAREYRDAALILARLPELVIERRQALGLAHGPAAAQIGIGKATLIAVETGKREGTKTTLIALLDWLETTT